MHPKKGPSVSRHPDTTSASDWSQLRKQPDPGWQDFFNYSPTLVLGPRLFNSLQLSLSLSIHHHLLYPWIKKHGGRLNLIHFHIYQNSLHDFSQNFPARSLTCSSRRQEPLAPSPDQRRLVQIMHDCFWCNLVQTHLVVAFYRMVRTQYKNTHFKHCSICVVCFIWFTCV